jgi:putative transport protein
MSRGYPFRYRVVTTREANGKTIGEPGQDKRARGVYLKSLQRGTELMPRETSTVVERGDILRITGAPDDIERAAAFIAFVDRDPS